jgi:anaerobic dimethyl sulfoxide reductase subunit B (iron-sulfur subunit)
MTMTKKTFLVDIDRCIGCFACEIACKDENDLTSGIRRVKVNSIDVSEFNRFYVPIFALDQQGIEGCTLCPQLQAEGRSPACVHNCLTNALHFGDEAEMKKKASGMPGEKMSIDYSRAVVIYTSRKPLRNVIPG